MKAGHQEIWRASLIILADGEVVGRWPLKWLSDHQVGRVSDLMVISDGSAISGTDV